MILILMILKHCGEVELLKTKAVDERRYEQLKHEEIKRLRRNTEAHGIPEYEYGRKKRNSEYPYGKR